VLRDEPRERRQTQWEEQTSTRLATFRRDNGLTQDQEEGLLGPTRRDGRHQPGPDR
jgi:hypothetical protein